MLSFGELVREIEGRMESNDELLNSCENRLRVLEDVAKHIENNNEIELRGGLGNKILFSTSRGHIASERNIARSVTQTVAEDYRFINFSITDSVKIHIAIKTMSYIRNEYLESKLEEIIMGIRNKYL